ncbi:hypothetical protein L3Y34_014252 [Caenorhabditis briggsae]|uniref:Uncharacterized protein n=1 Tax=Caenorhabditis briggsae TaxID=6238 RepID=A0AAE9DQE3_CAEBR|nr:hypothetical protein L3Y34_014252 [Caenorhabditis briggsae]
MDIDKGKHLEEIVAKARTQSENELILKTDGDNKEVEEEEDLKLTSRHSNQPIPIPMMNDDQGPSTSQSTSRNVKKVYKTKKRAEDTPPVKRGRPRKVKKEESPERLRSPSFDAPRPKRSCRAKSEAVVAQEEDEIVSDEEPLSSDTSYEVIYGHYVKVKNGWLHKDTGDTGNIWSLRQNENWMGTRYAHRSIIELPVEIRQNVKVMLLRMIENYKEQMVPIGNNFDAELAQMREKCLLHRELSDVSSSTLRCLPATKMKLLKLRRIIK